MDVPTTTPHQFLLLSCLLDGRAKTRLQLAKEVGWEEHLDRVSHASTKLHRDGLIEKTMVRVKRADKAQRRVYVDAVVRITAAGIRIWRETLDFYLFASAKWGNVTREPDAAGPVEETVLWQKRWQDPQQSKTWRRLPTGSEEDRILAAASPGFRLLYRAMRHTNATAFQLAALNIEHIDWTAGVVRVSPTRGRPEQIPVDETFARLLRKSIGKRTAGPIFVTPRGCRWKTGNIGEAFRRYRRLAGVPPHVKLDKYEPPWRGKGSRPRLNRRLG